MNRSDIHRHCTRPRSHVAWERGERGFSLILLSLTLTVLLAMLGLVVDLGKMFVVHNELQTFVDASAMAAATQLDGSRDGVQAADELAKTGPLGNTQPNRYNFETATVTNVITGYATTYGSAFVDYDTATGSATNNYRFVQVTASANVPLYFLPVIEGIPNGTSVTAKAVAGQQPQDTVWNGGLMPFLVDGHNPADAENFGLNPGGQYTLKWGNHNSTTCAGDAGFNPNLAPDAHGFVDIGEGNGIRCLYSHGKTGNHRPLFGIILGQGLLHIEDRRILVIRTCAGQVFLKI